MHRAPQLTILLALSLSPRAALAQAPASLWDLSFGVSSTQPGNAATDHAGGVYVTGYDTQPLYPPGDGGFLSRFSPAGTLIWGRNFNTQTERKGGNAIFSMADGAVFIAGGVTNRLAPPWDADAHLTRFNASGDQVWSRRLGSSSPDVASAVCADGYGGAYVAGHAGGALAAPNAGSRDIFLARYNADGDQLWVRQFGSPVVEYCVTAFPDGAGGVYIAGDTYGALGHTSHGSYDGWLARYSSDGQQLWLRQYGTPGGEGITALCSDGVGGLYAAGWVYGSFGAPSAGNSDAFLMRLTADGEPIWIRQLGSSGGDYGQGVSLAPDGGAYLFGDTSATLGSQSSGEADLFLARYSATGQLLWVSQWGTALQDISRAAAPDASGGVYVTGWRTIDGSGSRLATLARFPGPCYPNCDNSTIAPQLNIADFACFLTRFAAQDPYANCDNSTTQPTLNIADFACFLQQFAAGCN